MHYFIVIFLCFLTSNICPFEFMFVFYVMSLSMSAHLNFLDAFLQALSFIMKIEVPYFFFSFFGYFPFLSIKNIMFLTYSILWSEFQIFGKIVYVFDLLQFSHLLSGYSVLNNQNYLYIYFFYFQ